MLTAEQRHELETTGITYLRGALPRAEADAMAERVWRLFEKRGVLRDDASTWPATGFQTKLQALRQADAFAGFHAATDELVDELLSGVAANAIGPWAPLVSFPQPGPWRLPAHSWHMDFPATGDPDRPTAARLFGFVTDVAPEGGGTLVIEGSHEVVRRMVAASAHNHAGSSSDVKKRLARRDPWFRDPSFEPIEVDGVRVCARELTGEAGDVAVMLPWTIHNISMNCAPTPRVMTTRTWIAK